MNQPNQKQQEKQKLALPTSREYQIFYLQEHRRRRKIREIVEDLLPTAPVIVLQPEDQTVIALTENASFNVEATVDEGTLSYSWELDAGLGFVEIPLETASTLTIVAPNLGQNGNSYRAIVRANGRSKVSRAATLNVVVA